MSREDWLTDSFRRYLDRRTMPNGLKEKPRAQAEEIQALVSRLLKDAPGMGFQDWWDDFSDRLASNAQTRAWPTEFEIARAAKEMRKESAIRKPSALVDTRDNEQMRLDIMERRIRGGEPVADRYIYGRDWVALLDRTFLTEGDLKPYRSGMYFGLRDIYGENRALEIEAERRAAHELAIAEIDEMNEVSE